MNNITRYLLLFLLIFILVYSRLIGLDWGLPYAMHPDERNMVNAISMLECKSFSTECFNPKFFAYGQLPLYAAYLLKFPISYIYSGDIYTHAALALRIISALASIGTVFFLIKSVGYFTKPTKKILFGFLLFASFVPAFIQFAHFGTTESLLMFFYSVLLYFAVRFLHNGISLRRFSAISGVILGISLGTKVSGVVFAAIPVFALLQYAVTHRNKREWIYIFANSIKLVIFTGLFFVITSPYNFIVWADFMGAMQYESSVGLGGYRAFYTRQFEYTIPFIFQFTRVFPYSLGWPILILFVLGFFLLPFNKKYNFLRIQFLLFFIPNSLLYAKWSRFISPVFPIMVLIAYLMLVRIYSFINEKLKQPFLSKSLVTLILLISIIPGIAFSAIYFNSDVRFKASEWIYKNIPNESYILSETANVVDVPIPNPKGNTNIQQGRSYRYISFNFYDLNADKELNTELKDHISKASYIFIPSRRVFANNTCYVPNKNGQFDIQTFNLDYEGSRCAKLLKTYPELNAYYDKLFSGKLGFEQVAEFTSYPRIELFGIKLLEFPDEMSEETWTVFDHPVMRIYKRK